MPFPSSFPLTILPRFSKIRMLFYSIAMVRLCCSLFSSRPFTSDVKNGIFLILPVVVCQVSSGRKTSLLTALRRLWTCFDPWSSNTSCFLFLYLHVWISLSVLSAVAEADSLLVLCEVLVLCVLQGKKLVFVTNNSSKSRKKYSEKFQNLGLNVREVPISIHLSSSFYENSLWNSELIFSIVFCVRMRFFVHRLLEQCTWNPSIFREKRRWRSYIHHLWIITIWWRTC